MTERTPEPADVLRLSWRRLWPTVLLAVAAGVLFGIEYGPLAGVVFTLAVIAAVLMIAWILYRIGFVVLMRRATGKWRWRW